MSIAPIGDIYHGGPYPHITVPRESKSKHNVDITHYTEELCKATFDHDKEGKRFHCWDLARIHFKTIREAYPEIKTTKQFWVYVHWALQTLCWNNVAKVVEWDNDGNWYENIDTAADALNDALPVGAPWENRKPAAQQNKGKTMTERNHERNKAEWSVDCLTKHWRLNDQEIYDILTGAVNWTGEPATGFSAGAVKRALETRTEDGRYAFK